MEERIDKLESQVKAILEYIQWFAGPISGQDYDDIHFEQHQKIARHEAAITNQALEITMLKAQVETLRQTIIRLHSDTPVHPLVE